MRFYPAYTVSEALNLPANTFNMLLEQAYRLQFRDYLMLAKISLLPNTKKGYQLKFLRRLQRAASSPGDILQISDDDASIEQLKRIL